METKDFFAEIFRNSQQMSRSFPTKNKAHDFLESMINFLFPVCREVGLNPNSVELNWEHLQLHLKELLVQLKPNLKQDEAKIVELYFNQIPEIYRKLREDAKAILEFDPAAESMEEIILAYPGFFAIMVYRLSHPLYKLHVPILPRVISEYAHSKTGIDIHPGANIGDSFFIDHGTGIVIGETTQIGNNVKIYQGVTLGALNVRKEEAQTKRHPTIEDNVVIYSGSTILGGNTVVGRDSVIGGNVWLTESVEPFSLVYHKSEVRVRNNKDFVEPINFVI